MGSPRNGLTVSATPYEYRGKRGWNPAAGIHLDPSVVKEDKEAAAREAEQERRRAPEAASRPKAEKYSEFCEARDAGWGLEDASEYAGIAVNTGRKYERERRAAGTAVPSGGAP
jgi:hypothetical protein